MLFRHAGSLVDAVRFDGSEASIRAVFGISRAAAAWKAGEIELSTAQGRRVARIGSWVTRDVATQAVKLYDEALFQAGHEVAH